MIRNKKAEMSSGMIITVVLVIIGFVILALVYGGIEWGSMSEEQACKSSVIARASLPQLAGTQNLMPLNCVTKKICVRGKKIFGGGECEEFENFNNIQKVDVEKEWEIEKVIADEIVSCWSMMGEGKLPLFPSGSGGFLGYGGVYSSCVICSRIAFEEESLKEEGIDLSSVDVSNYMKTHEAPGTNKTYWGYLVGKSPGDTGINIDEGIKLESIEYEDEDGKKQKLFGDMTSYENLLEESPEIEESSELNTQEMAIIFSQVSAPKHGEEAANLGKLVGAGAVAGGVGTTVKAATKVCKGQAALVCLGVAAAAIGVQQGNIAHQRSVTASKCGDIVSPTSGENPRDGCSAVRTTSYDIGSIKEYCGSIESKAGREN